MKNERYITIVQESTSTGFRREIAYSKSEIFNVLNLTDEELMDFILSEIIPNNDSITEFCDDIFKDDDSIDEISIFVSVKTENKVQHILHKKFTFDMTRCQQ